MMGSTGALRLILFDPVHPGLPHEPSCSRTELLPDLHATDGRFDFEGRRNWSLRITAVECHRKNLPQVWLIQDSHPTR